METFLPEDYYIKKYGNNKFIKTDNHYRINIDFGFLGEKLQYAQQALDAQVWNDVQKYMPVDTGALKSSTDALNIAGCGRVMLYPPESDYGHYQYEGKLYVDPVTKKGAFYSPAYGFWSRPGVSKVETDQSLTYSQPDATSHWGETAYDNHFGEWVAVVQRALNK